MPAYLIPDPATLQREISASHDRCRRYGVDPTARCNPKQKKLTPEQLRRRIEQNSEFLDIAITQIQELYRFVAGAGFAVNIADHDGYILHIIGDAPIVEHLAGGNCCPGFRWTEKDVGTSVISLSLERKISVQINDDEHFCERGHGYTCSAAPVFDPENQLLGVIAMSGNAAEVHPHTLGMIITAARAIENQLRIRKASKALILSNNYMKAILDSIDSGVMAVDNSGVIQQVNNQGTQILQTGKTLVSKTLKSIFGSQLNLEQIQQPGFEMVDREMILRTPRRVVHLMCTAKPISDAGGQIQGAIVVFNEMNRIRKLFNEIAGTQARFTFEDIIGTSRAILEAKKMAMIAATGNATVLLLGETGTGKELFAQAIHNYSARKDHPFLAINCGAIPRELLESELFGYAEGAFTGARRGGRPGKFELTNGGTVLLDEIGDMPTDMQVKLLRVLETGEVYRIGEHKSISVDVRIIAATNSNLKEKVAQRIFREDLFYRLNVFPIVIAPLRDRIEDISPLTRHIVKRCCHGRNIPGVVFEPGIEQALAGYHWPGNIRELENVLERAVNLAEKNCLETKNLGLPGVRSARAEANAASSRLQDVEKETIITTLQETGFNLSRSSKTLGISRATLYNKIKKYKVQTNRM
jgi:transcriptional regulator with PAS, ATPase and Fis domain